MNQKREDDMSESTIKPLGKEPGMLRDLWHQIRLVLRLMADSDVPIYLKVLPILTIGYLLFPLDVVTDFLPVLGQLDDVMVLLLGSKIFIELSPQHVVNHHLQTIREAAGFLWQGDEESDGEDVAEKIVIDGQPLHEKDPNDMS